MMIIMLLLMIALGLGGYYVARRLFDGLRFLFPRLWHGVLYILWALLVGLPLMGLQQGAMPAALAHTLGTVGAISLGTALYLGLSFGLSELVLLCLRWVKPHKKALKRFVATCAALGLALGVSLYGYLHAAALQTAHYRVAIEDAGALRIVMVSDLHLGAVLTEERLPGLVEAINGQSPDLVCICGDIFDSDFTAIKDPEAVAATLRQLQATYGVYACLGNHDAGPTHTQMVQFLPQCNILLLKDDYVVIDDRFVLLGRLDGTPIGGFAGRERQSLDKVLAGAPQLPTIVMDHNPQNADGYGPETDLLLCGHTHRGQLFPLNLITGAVYYRDYGHYQRSPQSPQVIISSGAGYWGIPMRVGTDCELVVVDICGE